MCIGCEPAKDEPQRPPPLVVEPAAEKAEPQPQPNNPKVEDVIEISTPDATFEPTAVPSHSVSATLASAQWRDVARFPEPLEFVYVASGVVARSSAGIHELGEEKQLQLRPGFSLPESPLVGHWPDDVWSIESSPAEATADGQLRFEYHVLRLDPDTHQWVVQTFRNKDRWIGELHAVRKGWHGGLLVREPGRVTRLGSLKAAPEVGTRMGKLLLDTIESNSGQLYTVSQRPTGVHVQGHCPDLECVRSSAKKLPFGIDWSFSIQVPRQRNSLSVAARVDIDGAPVHYLLHFEVGGWKLEPLDLAATGLWANAEGGLWAKLGEELWYRSPNGDWFAVALPDGAGDFTAALLEDGSELWISTTVDGQARVYATAAIFEPVTPR